MIVGIEVTSAALRAVRLDRFRPGRAPERVMEVPFVPVGANGLPPAETVSKLLRDLDARGAVVAVALPSAWCFYRRVAFPYPNARRVESTLAYALEGRLPGKIENYVIEPLSDLLPAGGGAHLHVAACSSDRLKDLLATFQAAGVEPCIVQPAVAALARIIPSPQETLLVRFDAGTLEVAVLRNGEVLCADVMHAVAADGIVRHVLNAVRAREVSDGTGAFRRAVLVAPGGVAATVAEELQSALGVPLEPPSGSIDALPWLAATGVAADAAQRRHAASTLRRGPWAYRPYARRTERRVVAALALALASVCLFGVYTLRLTADVEGAIRRARAAQAKLFTEVTGLSAVPNLKLMETAVANALKESDRTGRTRVVSCLGRWSDLMKLAPADGSVTFETIEIGQQRLSLSGRAAGPEAVYAFRRNVEASAAFQSDPPVVTKSPRGAEATFTMELRYR